MRRFKFLFVLLLLLAAVWAIGEWAVPGAVSRAITVAARESTGVPARVDQVEVGWTSGELTLTNLLLATPPGFSGEHTLRIERVLIKIDLSTVAADVLLISRVDVIGAELVLEQQAARFSTREIAQHVRRYLAGADTTGSKRIRIAELHITGGRASLSTEAGDVGSFDVPDLVLRDLGGAEGSPLPVILGNIVEPLLERTATNIDSVPDALGKLRDRFGI